MRGLGDRTPLRAIARRSSTQFVAPWNGETAASATASANAGGRTRIRSTAVCAAEVVRANTTLIDHRQFDAGVDAHVAESP